MAQLSRRWNKGPPEEMKGDVENLNPVESGVQQEEEEESLQKGLPLRRDEARPASIFSVCCPQACSTQ